jgi:hypothetical protein
MISLLYSRLGAAVSLLSLATGAACSSSSSSTPPVVVQDSGVPVADAGPTFNDHGIVLDYSTSKPLAGITITDGAQTFTTDATGAFAFQVPAATPMTLLLTGPNYTKTYLPELSLTADYDRATIPLPDLSITHLAQLALDGYDTSRGIVYLVVAAIGSCATVEGGSVTIVAPADGKVGYFDKRFPSASRTTFKANETPAAAVYNVPAGTQIEITITHPTCTMAPFPVTVAGVTYTGKVTVEAGDVSTVANYYLQ